jgi:outer membrane lipoprotein-sorting protein
MKSLVPGLEERFRFRASLGGSMSYLLRRMPLSRLLLLCTAVVAFGVGATALAGALSTGPVPPPKPLAQAVHDALAAEPVAGVSARITLTDHLLEGSNLASQSGVGGGGIASDPLVTGASGRLWLSNDGHIRVELQSEAGDTQLLYDGRTLTLYDAASNSVYRYAVPQGSGGEGSNMSSDSSAGAGATAPGGQPVVVRPDQLGAVEPESQRDAGSGADTTTGEHKIPTVTEIQEAIDHIMGHANLTGATPTDVAGQAAYAVKISPRHNGGLVGGAELAWDANHGVPLRVAVYSTQSAAPVLELAATEISYEAVPASVFEFSVPPNAKVTEVQAPQPGEGEKAGGPQASGPQTGNGAAGTKQAHPQHESGLTAVQAATPFTIDAPATLAGMEREDVQGAQVNGKAGVLVSYGEGLGGIAVLESAAKQAGEGAGGSANGSASTNPSGGNAGGESEEEAGGGALGELPKVPLGGGVSATQLPTPLGTLMSFKRGGVEYLLAGSVTPSTLQEAAKGL